MTRKRASMSLTKEGTPSLSSSHRNTVRTLSNAALGQTHRSKQCPLNTIVRRQPVSASSEPGNDMQPPVAKSKSGHHRPGSDKLSKVRYAKIASTHRRAKEKGKR